MPAVARVIRILALVAALLLLATPAFARADYGRPVPGQHIYDLTGLLTPEEIADLEARAAAVEQAGAPIVVYLQARNASQSETEEDARALMDAWDVQSAPGARDGVVMFFNLKPGDLRRGQVFIYAGEAHYQGGNLPRSELERIVSEVMIPLLKEDRTAAGIAAGLDALATALAYGPPPPPPPSRFEQVAQDLAAGAFSIVNLVAGAVAAVTLALGVTRYRAGRTARGSPMPTTMRPDSRPPAVAGALVEGRIDDRHLEATLLDLARRGAIAIEPVGKDKVQVRLIDRSALRAPFEEALWDALTECSDGGDVVSPKQLGSLRRAWGRAKEELRKQLEAEGLYDPAAGQRRRPVYLAAGVAMALAPLAFLLAVVADEPLSVIGAVLLLLTSMVCFGLGSSIPDTTPAGAAAAAPWRGYENGIAAARNERAAVLDLDEIMPYAVAFGVVDALDKRLREASKAGYRPAWLGSTTSDGAWDGGFYPYWVGFHSSVTPASSSGADGGGASAGGGGAGGSF